MNQMNNETCFVKSCGKPATIKKTKILGAPYGKTKISESYYVCEDHRLTKNEVSRP